MHLCHFYKMFLLSLIALPHSLAYVEFTYSLCLNLELNLLTFWNRISAILFAAISSYQTAFLTPVHLSASPFLTVRSWGSSIMQELINVIKFLHRAVDGNSVIYTFLLCNDTKDKRKWFFHMSIHAFNKKLLHMRAIWNLKHVALNAEKLKQVP
jgi:hypothetical protein